MFEIKDKFYLNGEPFRIVSGAIHYFRTVPEYWRDRLEKLVNMGCNTVETYIPWNFHEPNRGEFLWEGRRDVFRFIEIARELGLYMILRPSPYICAEWEFGGLPAWLLKDKDMRLRCSHKPYLDAVYAYYRELIPRLAPYQVDRGGNIILIQIENEYGYYGNDKAYLEFLRDTMRELGITVPFVTSDGPWSEPIFRSGVVEGALPTGNFGSSAEWQFTQLKKIIGEQRPLMCMEFWNGWFDAWGEEHHVTPPEKAAAELDELLKRGNVNFYMFEGGTNFGFMSGRNNGNKTADVTSYDYDAPLTEDGRITEKYERFKSVIAKYRDFEPIPLSTEIRRKSYGEIKRSGRVDLFTAVEKLSAPVRSVYPLSMEEIGQNYGYILYRLRIPEHETIAVVSLENAADRVMAFHNGQPLFSAENEELHGKFEPKGLSSGGILDLFCENVGRENFGTDLENQRKGILGGVKVNDHRCYHYEIFPLPLDEEQIAALDFGGECAEGVPAFYRFEFTTDDPCDTFLDPEGFGRGCAFINGFNLGRFWEIGPQKRLYIPAPLLRKGKNTVILFETEGKAAETIRLSDVADLG
ncbi:MAG: beta-galactosidase [Bacteroides sp.]|nr:beta-galactosidase [Eubacterium sp.]MCM1417881.1 beta-galactosidase [Roseburia sp.]MCM1461955.1 beta-galactosidase [Bacteroides sp.]